MHARSELREIYNSAQPTQKTEEFSLYQAVLSPTLPAVLLARHATPPQLDYK